MFSLRGSIRCIPPFFVVGGGGCIIFYYNWYNIIYYTVKKGDNLQKIATRNHVTISQLRKWNGIKGSTIYPRQRLKIYK